MTNERSLPSMNSAMFQIIVLVIEGPTTRLALVDVVPNFTDAT